ncbi:nuclear autoantigen Sp-100-like isoform X3 [Psammomys obesus]|uniref:nuclear autoantigen Sp-100-like isoform X3 n=1 Tax=Psammomys obesus TaxID=48139 RepID=UPI002452C11E|nr:nuclear autoantigen Sp-100-like isoform X3 [Psammomys obesus]
MEGSSMSTRMSTNHENTEMFSNNAILQYFKKQKLVISYAIKKPFPFLEGLRDHELITDKMYHDFQDSCRSLVPLHEVIYKALEELEKNFNMTVLQELFCEVNMENYPHLEPISTSFNNVFPNALCFQGSDRGGLNSHLSLEQGPGESCSQGSLTWSPMNSSSSDEAAKRISSRTQTSIGIQCPKFLAEWEGGRRDARGATTLIRGIQTENHQPSEPHNRTAVSLPANGLSEDLCEAVQISRLGRAATGDSTELGRKQATVPQGPDSEPEDTRNIENNPTSAKDGGSIMMTGMNLGPRVPTAGHCANPAVPLLRTRVNLATPSWKSLAFQRRRVNPSQRSRKRGPRIPRQNADFSRPVLPVSCGKAEGKLHREKFEKGIYEKSIENKKGQWFTPPEFEIEGKHQNSKKWRQSIRCFGWTLQELIKEGKLPNPPRKRKQKENPPNPQQTKQKLENSETCTVCRQRWKLYPCANCRNSYHKKCHIPPVEDESGQWCCVFCKTETNDQLQCQGNQACPKESGALKRKMSSKDQLRCEQLLLTIYCYPISAFFIPKPKQRKEDFPDLQKHMWLNKIKKRLNKKAYHSVQSFVRDMRLIFQNHSIFYKDKFKTLGVTVGSIFEENFERIFSNKDPSKRLQACNHVILLT